MRSFQHLPERQLFSNSAFFVFFSFWKGEGEYKGTITSYAAGTLVIAGATLTVNDSTSFEDLTENDLDPGQCVEVKGRLISGVLTATRIKAEDDCS